MSTSTRNRRLTHTPDAGSTEQTLPRPPTPVAAISDLTTLEAVAESSRVLEATLTTHSCPGNIAQIRRLLVQYERQLEFWRSQVLAAPMAPHHPIGHIKLPGMPATQIRNEVRGILEEVEHHLNETNLIVLYAIARLEVRKRRCEDALKLKNRRTQFQEAMRRVFHANLFI
ncbi:hypothetical protein GJ744_009374 [Endocarpon pusillum]|uniref:Uncharacterized protein n=1 Tax=Endocarpon pusillum TaxID=364733 RepID=A0A8H7AFY2_9EURO|nr:hypothetical protein GJ744_009374 [Endocarpon pusillum]